MSLPKEILIEHLLERIYDVLWHNQVIVGIEEHELKNVLRKDIEIQLEIILDELKR